ncbi:hypothetical protein [Methylomicrobium lacus]|uniref:hypothetical protein n=1 Tax=Methylomicrobium lacus TaxID=136992 RepID=UPI0035A918F7
MNIDTTTSSGFRALVFCTLLGLMAGQSAQAADFNPQPDPPGFGMLGVAGGQTARLNVRLERVPDQTYPPDPYRVTLYFLNGDGRVLTQQTFPVIAGQSAFLDYAAPAITLGQRQRIRPIVTVEPDARGNTPDFNSMVEVIDNVTQRTAFVYPGRHNPPADTSAEHNPPSDYTSGIVGITRGQAARLNVINTVDIHNPDGLPPDPYRVTLSFYTKAGVLLAQTTKLLAPGQAAALDVKAANFPPSQGSRLELYPVVSVVPDINGIVPCVMPTVEGFDIANGKTAFLVPAI